MTTTHDVTTQGPGTQDTGALDLEISRLVAAPRRKVWQAWTDPEILPRWWCPRPWTTELIAFELRPGGAFHTLMTGPEGGRSDNPGSFLEVVAMERIVFTTMLTGGWRPGTPWLGITAFIDMADEDGGTRYVARVLHRDEAEAKRHEDLGFFDGWGTCIDQLEEVACSL